MSGRRAKRERKLARAQQPPARPTARPAVQQSMPQRYEVLHYRGNVTSSAGAQPGAILGHDELGRPYEVIDAEYAPVFCGVLHYDGSPCPGNHGMTTVQLQYATAENLRAAMAGGAA